MLVYLLAPVGVTQQENTSVANFTKKQNVLTGGSAIFGEAKYTDSRAMGVWTDARAHTILENAFFEIPLYELNPSKTG